MKKIIAMFTAMSLLLCVSCDEGEDEFEEEFQQEEFEEGGEELSLLDSFVGKWEAENTTLKCVDQDDQNLACGENGTDCPGLTIEIDDNGTYTITNSFIDGVETHTGTLEIADQDVKFCPADNCPVSISEVYSFAENDNQLTMTVPSKDGSEGCTYLATFTKD